MHSVSCFETPDRKYILLSMTLLQQCTYLETPDRKFILSCLHLFDFYYSLRSLFFLLLTFYFVCFSAAHCLLHTFYFVCFPAAYCLLCPLSPPSFNYVEFPSAFHSWNFTGQVGGQAFVFLLFTACFLLVSLCYNNFL